MNDEIVLVGVFEFVFRSGTINFMIKNRFTIHKVFFIVIKYDS